MCSDFIKNILKVIPKSLCNKSYIPKIIVFISYFSCTQERKFIVLIFFRSVITIKQLTKHFERKIFLTFEFFSVKMGSGLDPG